MMAFALAASMLGVQDGSGNTMPTEVVVAHVSGAQRGEGVQRLQADFQARNPGYRVVMHTGAEPLQLDTHSSS